MKLSKFAPLALSALLVGTAAAAGTVSADEENKEVSEREQKEPAFVKAHGTIESVEKLKDSVHYTIKEGEETPSITVTEETLIFDNTGKKTELKKGDTITAYTNAGKPMILIYPPQYSPDAVIVETEEASSAAAGHFDSNLLDEQLELKLNIGDKTEIVKASGEKAQADDLKNQDLLVFYTMETMSLPAQTTPEKVVILDTKTEDEASLPEVIEQMIKNDHYMKDGVKMVPLRLLAEEMGFKVESTGAGAIVSKGAPSYTITRGQKDYGYNKALLQLEAAPELLEKNKTYVPVSLIEDMMKLL